MCVCVCVCLGGGGDTEYVRLDAPCSKFSSSNCPEAKLLYNLANSLTSANLAPAVLNTGTCTLTSKDVISDVSS